jgi:hypothetical protein
MRAYSKDLRVKVLDAVDRGMSRAEVAAGLSGWADVVVGQLGSFAPGEKEAVMRFLIRLISALQGAGVITVARMCMSCRFFRPDAYPRSVSPHYCALLDLPISGPTAPSTNLWRSSTDLVALHQAARVSPWALRDTSWV